MLNKIEYLLACLSEEASEVSQEAIKCVRFTMHHRRDDFTSNAERLNAEFNDLLAIVEELNKYGANIHRDEQRIKAKRMRLAEYSSISVQMGTASEVVCSP